MNTMELNKIMSIDECYKEFIKDANTFVTKFVETENIKEAARNVLDIVFDFTSTAPSHKGVVLWSVEVGKGKTLFFEILNSFHRRFYKEQSLFKMVTSHEIVRAFTDKQNGGYYAVDELTKANTLFIDDLGREPSMQNNFGNKANILEDVIIQRYEKWCKTGAKTYFTSNLTIEELYETYGNRATDRLIEMAEFVNWQPFDEEFKDASFRHLGNDGNGGVLRRYSGVEHEQQKLKLKQEQNKLELEAKKNNVNVWLNSILNQSEEQIKSNKLSFWFAIKNVLIEKCVLSEDFIKSNVTHSQYEEVSNEAKLDYDLAMKMPATKSGIKFRYKNRQDKAPNECYFDDIKYRLASWAFVRDFMISLKNKKYKF